MHMRFITILLCLGLTTTCNYLRAQDNGEVSGKILFVGDIPQQETLKVAGDKVCEELAKGNPPRLEDVIVNPNRTLKNVVVWIESGWPEGKKPASGNRPAAVLTQRNCRFEPHVLPVTIGQAVELQNDDPTLHNVNLLPKKNPRFNRTSFGKQGEPSQLKFDTAEQGIRVKDDIHPWMTAWIVVLDNAAFDMSDETGDWKITGLPQGEYKITAWHEKFGTVTTEVIVSNESPANVSFSFTATGDKAGNQVFADDATTSSPR